MKQRKTGITTINCHCGHKLPIPANLAFEQCPNGPGHMLIHRMAGTGYNLDSYPTSVYRDGYGMFGKQRLDKGSAW